MSKSKLTGIAPGRSPRLSAPTPSVSTSLGDLVRPGWVVLVGGPGGALPGRARQRLRQPRVARRRHGQPLLRRRRAAGLRVSAADHEIGAIEQRATDAAWSAIERLAIQESIGATWELVDALNGYLTVEEPWTLAKDPHRRRASKPCSPRRTTGSARSPCCSRPCCPRRRRSCGRRWSPRHRAGAAHRPRQRVDGRRARGAARGAVPAHRGLGVRAGAAA